MTYFTAATCIIAALVPEYENLKIHYTWKSHVHERNALAKMLSICKNISP